MNKERGRKKKEGEEERKDGAWCLGGFDKVKEGTT